MRRDLDVQRRTSKRDAREANDLSEKINDILSGRSIEIKSLAIVMSLSVVICTHIRMDRRRKDFMEISQQFMNALSADVGDVVAGIYREAKKEEGR